MNAPLSSNPRLEMRERMLADEERSEQAFEELSFRIALEAHEDRLKLWEDSEYDRAEIKRLRSALSVIAAQWSGTPGSTARADCMAVIARQALRATDETNDAHDKG